MFDNQNYPWYLQQSPIFDTLYNGIFPIVSAASPLEVSQMFDLNQQTGLGLLYFGRMWGLRGIWGGQTTGLIYDIDKWSTDKVWTGEIKDLDAQIYRNFIRMKAYINGRAYNLNLLKEALAILMSGQQHTVTVDESFMHFTINITASSELLNIMYNMEQYDKLFLGKPTGISYNFNYIPDDGSPPPGTTPEVPE